MPAVIKDSRSPAGGARQKKNRLPIVIAAVVVLLGVLFAIKPPFVVRPLPGREGASGEAGSQPTESSAAKFVDGVWDKLGSVFDEKAQDISQHQRGYFGQMNTDSQKHFSNREWTRINANKSNSFVSIRVHSSLVCLSA
jgi:hypothetical protein